jgi:hypothetical protein
MQRLRMPRRLWRVLLLSGVLGAVGLGVAISAGGAPTVNATAFRMVRSPGIVTSGCLPNATGKVSIVSKGAVEVMRVQVFNLPRNTNFDFFVIQAPNAPFGLSWYQGDIETNGQGRGEGTFVGRFNVETFIVAPGAASAPKVHDADATTNPATAPVHTFHLGLWFNSPADATAAGCPGATTPFNGDHTAGVQVLNTANFANDQGPLRKVTP